MLSFNKDNTLYATEIVAYVFAFCVQGTRGFVEKENLRVRQQSTSYCYSLLLTTGEPIVMASVNILYITRYLDPHRFQPHNILLLYT